jgi:hypothetical protein
LVLLTGIAVRKYATCTVSNCYIHSAASLALSDIILSSGSSINPLASNPPVLGMNTTRHTHTGREKTNLRV